MTRSLLLLLLVATPLVAAPVPRERQPDPMDWAYMGVRVEFNSMRVSSTDAGTPANKAGIQPNDLIVRVGNITPRNFEDVSYHVMGMRPGARIVIQVRRGSQLIDVPMILGERPADAIPPEIVRQRLQGGDNLLPLP